MRKSINSTIKKSEIQRSEIIELIFSNEYLVVYFQISLFEILKLQMSKKIPRNFTKPTQISKHLCCAICTEVFQEPTRLACG